LTETAGLSILLDERAIPLTPAVRGACELLGLDPLYIANEGKLVAVVSAATAELALNTLRRHPLGSRAAVIGEVQSTPPGEVLVRGVLGALRPLDEPTGAPLPRIC
jgi:hydrogenase expression/formation protein HypE